MNAVSTATLPVVAPASTRSLVLVNAGTIVLAVIFDWPATTLMWPCWVQSVMIGSAPAAVATGT